MDPYATNYFNNYAAYNSGASIGTGTMSNDRSGARLTGINTSSRSFDNAHRASDPGCFTRPSLSTDDSMDLSRFDLLARSAVGTLHVQDVIKPAHNTPWVGTQQQSFHREVSKQPSLHRNSYAKSEPLLRHEMYSDAADSGYVSHRPGAQPIANHYSMNIRELEQDYHPLLEVLSPTGGAEIQSTASDGRLMGGGKHRKSKRPLTQCPQCGRQPRNLSDSKKHALTHTKPYRCTEQDCTRKDGFATENDLQRHRKSVHNLLPTVGSPAGYICAACVPEADAPPKFWPRRDNFKAHIKRKHPHHHEAILIEGSRRRLRPGDGRAPPPDAESVRDIMCSAQRSEFDPNEMTYESSGPLGFRNDSLVQSDHNGGFGPDSGLAMSNEQALVSMQGHTLGQYGNASVTSSGYGGQHVDAYVSGAAEIDCNGYQSDRLLTVLSEAANSLDYSTGPLFVSGPRRSSKHPPDHGRLDRKYKATSSYPCQYPDCSKLPTHEYGFTYGDRFPSAS